MKKIVSILLCIVLLLSLCGCNKGATTVNLMQGIEPNPSKEYIIDDSSAMYEGQMKFSVELFKKSSAYREKGNVLVSPLSVYVALAITANGAKDETHTEMMNVLGASSDSLNAYIKSYVENLPQNEKYKLMLANSIWFRDDNKRLKVEPSFLQTNADYFGAGIYKSPFDDTTVDDINGWIKENTEGQIEKIIDSISVDTVMYIFNSLVFDAQWDVLYEQNDIKPYKFSCYTGETKSVDMMFSDVSGFISDHDTTGFIKDYKDGKYSFVALLPDKETDIYSYISSISDEKISSILKSREEKKVYTGIPRFSYDYSISMNEVLKDMGMPTAFNSNLADFRDMATSSVGNIYIGDVIHKTHIEISEKGTKASSATGVAMTDKMAINPRDESVILDRPFVYMIIENEHQLPLFIGAVTDIGK